MTIDRRTFLAGFPLATGCFSQLGERSTLPSSKILGAEAGVGHDLRTALALPQPGQDVKTRVLIVGSGASGAAAAYTLRRAGFHDFQMIDLADEYGGNARSGENSQGRFPLGAHYLPEPGQDNFELRAFLEDAGAMLNGQLNEDFVCHDQEERLYYQGAWHEGLIPLKSLRASERKDVEAFTALIASLRLKKDKSGKKVFRIPLDESSRDAEYLAWDRITFADFIRGQGFHSPFLHWYLNYCCRDDYGTDWEETSAWAGLHYFAARGGDEEKVLTWPEGNHWLIKKLMRGSEASFHGSELAYRMTRADGKWQLDSYSRALQKATRWTADVVILAVPRFIAARLLPLPFDKSVVSYAPWMVANLHVKSLPQSESGPGLAWDNVPFGSASLGYVVANHQALARYPSPGALTSYWPLTGGSSDYLHTIAGFRGADDWSRMIVQDFEDMHPGYGSEIENISLWVWGHGMIQPKPGFLWGDARAALLKEPPQGIYLAHSDMSGISIFEEAFYRGVTAGKKVLKVLG